MPVTVAVCSLFRDCAKTIDYFRAALEHQKGEDLKLVFSFVEGDSVDGTRERLRAWADADPRVILGRMDVEPLADFEDRVSKWAALGNAAIEQLADRPYDFLFWCESDLCLPQDLLSWLLADDVDVVAPGIFLGGMFYDTWGFRALDGTRFANEPPYHKSFAPHALVELASVGSAVLFKRAVIDAGVRFRGTYEDGLLVGFCNDARDNGFRVWMDSRVCVVHPMTAWRSQQYELGGVRLEGFDDDAFTRTVWQDMARKIENTTDLILGNPELPAGHTIFDDLRRMIENWALDTPFSLESALLSESPKRYALIIRNLSDEASSCPPAATP